MMFHDHNDAIYSAIKLVYRILMLEPFDGLIEKDKWGLYFSALTHAAFRHRKKDLSPYRQQAYDLLTKMANIAVRDNNSFYDTRSENAFFFSILTSNHFAMEAYRSGFIIPDPLEARKCVDAQMELWGIKPYQSDSPEPVVVND